MCDLIDGIRVANAEDMDDLLRAITERYEAVFPDWEVVTIAIQKKKDRNEQIDKMIAMLEEMKTAI